MKLKKSLAIILMMSQSVWAQTTPMLHGKWKGSCSNYSSSGDLKSKKKSKLKIVQYGDQEVKVNGDRFFTGKNILKKSILFGLAKAQLETNCAFITSEQIQVLSSLLNIHENMGGFVCSIEGSGFFRGSNIPAQVSSAFYLVLKNSSELNFVNVNADQSYKKCEYRKK